MKTSNELKIVLVCTPSIYEDDDKSDSFLGIIKDVTEMEQRLEELEHFKTTVNNFYAIDADPKTVDKEWIEKNAIKIEFPPEKTEPEEVVLIREWADHIILAGAAYKRSENLLEIHYKGGSVYHYFNVPLEAWEGFSETNTPILWIVSNLSDKHEVIQVR